MSTPGALIKIFLAFRTKMASVLSEPRAWDSIVDCRLCRSMRLTHRVSAAMYVQEIPIEYKIFVVRRALGSSFVHISDGNSSR